MSKETHSCAEAAAACKGVPKSEIVARELWRNPTPSEVRFGYGCTYYTMFRVLLPKNRRWIKIDGQRWNVLR